ncbi:MAG: hypothetical protein LHV68_01145 [Elusimicrobia bacterium]|nr:hypothetical protein [Candidatus Liberimonas magnetica]
MKNLILKKLYLALLSVILFPVFLHADKLDIDTNYRIRGISYQNNRFDNSINDSISYYSQRMQLSIKGNFSTNIEIGTKITALGVAGSTKTVFSVLKTTFPYQNANFVPFIENVYFKVKDLADMPVELTIGKQSLEFGDGLVLSDNGLGYFAFRITARYEKPWPLKLDVFTAKVTDNLRPTSDRDLYGGVGSITLKKNLLELGYFQDVDHSGSFYNQNRTSSIIKNFISLRLGRQERFMNYQLEYVKQAGQVSEINGTNITFDGFGYVARGELIGERTKLGKVAAHALLAINSGNSDVSGNTDGLFSPDLTKRYDGLERVGYGKLFAASPFDAFFEIPSSYSGIDTLGVGSELSPWYGWTFGVNYFLYSASQGPNGAPVASGFERIFGAEFTLGIELDLSAQYVFSKYLATQFSYSRYTPPAIQGYYWSKRDPATFYNLEMLAKF